MYYLRWRDTGASASFPLPPPHVTMYRDTFQETSVSGMATAPPSGEARDGLVTASCDRFLSPKHCPTFENHPGCCFLGLICLRGARQVCTSDRAGVAGLTCSIAVARVYPGACRQPSLYNARRLPATENLCCKYHPCKVFPPFCVQWLLKSLNSCKGSHPLNLFCGKMQKRR